jgi:hypothetical protein
MKFTHHIKKSLYIFIILLTLFCRSETGSGTASRSSLFSGVLANLLSAFNPKPMLKNISENIIYDLYASYATKMNTMKTSCNTANWKEAILVLKQTEMIDFGYSSVYSTLDPWPTYYQTPNSISTTANSMAASDLINGTGNCITIATSIYTTASTLAYNWNPSNLSSYSIAMQTAGSSNEFYKTDKEVIDKIINCLDALLEKMKDDKVGYPGGLSTSALNTKHLSSIEYVSVTGINIQILQKNMLGFRKIYSGNGGAGLSEYVTYYNSDLNSRILVKMDEVDAALSALTDLNTDIVNNSTKVSTLFTKLKELKVLIGVELKGNLGTTITTTTGSGDGD